jgi:PAS domain S-box-containing protein
VFDHTTDRLYAGLLEEDVSDLYENAPCGYFSATEDGILLRVNATFLTMTGYTRERLLDQTRLFDLLTIGGRILFETHLRPLLRMQGFLREIAIDFVCANGRQMPALLNATERRADGAPVAVIRAMVIDATERRLYERELLLARRKAEEAARARSDLIAMVSHDVRAPLGAAVTAAAMLETSQPTAKQQRYIGIIKSSVAQSVTLLDSMLDLSALEGGRPVLHEKPFEFRQLVEQVGANAALAAAPKPLLSVRATVDDAVPQQLVGDRHKLAQVLTNLMTNAVKFTDQGTVSLVVYAREVAAESATLECVVSDTGIGIPADRLPHIFEEFTQGSEEIAERYGGSGLGLAITRKLLRLYRSELHVTSTLGQGTTFSFTLQLRRADT